MFLLRDIPPLEFIQSLKKRFPDIDPSGTFTLLTMLRLSTDIMAAGETFFAKHGISHGRFVVLMLLDQDSTRGFHPSDMAERIGVTRATMTGLLDGLERDELVERRQNDEDRRTITIHLTEKGKQLLKDMLPFHFQRVAALMKQLSESDRKQLVSLLKKMEQEADAAQQIGL